MAIIEGITAFAISIQLDNSAALKLLGKFAPSGNLVLVGVGVGEATVPLGDAALRTRLGVSGVR